MDRETSSFIRSISAARTSQAIWQGLSDYAAAAVGHRLFTVMTVDMAAGLARRAFSDHLQDYPVSGTKPIHDNEWFDIVHGERRTFIANTIEDIARVFPDHELIASLGCGSVMNLPVVLGEELVATINMLHAEQYFTPERVAAAEALLPIPAMLCCALAERFDLPAKKPD